MPQALDSKFETETFDEKLQRVVDRLNEPYQRLLLEGLPSAARARTAGASFNEIRSGSGDQVDDWLHLGSS